MSFKNKQKIISTHAPTKRSSEYRKQNLVELKKYRQIQNYGWQFQHCSLCNNKTITPEISKELEDLNNIINQLELFNIHRILLCPPYQISHSFQ